MIAVNCFVPDNLIASITPLIVGPGNDPWTNHNFIGLGTDLTVNGLQGNGTTKYLDSGVIPSSAFASEDSGGMTMYSFTSGVSLGNDVGCSTGTNFFCLQLNTILNVALWECWDTGVGKVQGGNTGFKGFLSGNRTAANNSKLYRASSTVPFAQIGSIATTGGVRPNDPIIIFGASNSGVVSQFTNRTYSFEAVHFGLTSSEDQTLFNLVQSLRVALGGGYV